LTLKEKQKNMNIEMLLNDEHKKENENIIKELKIHNIFIENKLQQISIIYITNKNKYDYELAKTFINNLQNFIEEITDIQFNKSEKYILYLSTIQSINENPYNGNFIINQKNEINKLFYSICNEEQNKLINLMHINEKKIKIYENLFELYLCNHNNNCDDKDDDSDELEIIKNNELKPEQNISVITNIIFMIMVLFCIIVIMITVFLINQNHFQYNNEQCSKFINKQCKLNELF